MTSAAGVGLTSMSAEAGTISSSRDRLNPLGAGLVAAVLTGIEEAGSGLVAAVSIGIEEAGSGEATTASGIAVAGKIELATGAAGG